jgi:hypothetical protein
MQRLPISRGRSVVMALSAPFHSIYFFCTNYGDPSAPLPNKITARYSYLYSRILPLSPFSLIWQIESLPTVTVAIERSPAIEPFLINVTFHVRVHVQLYIWHIEQFIYSQTHLPRIMSYFHFYWMVENLIVEFFEFMEFLFSGCNLFLCTVQYISLLHASHRARQENRNRLGNIHALLLQCTRILIVTV